MSGKRLGVFGGTFNPIHLGHLHIAQEFARLLSLDEVLLIPAAVPPHKAAKDLASGETRLELCRLAVQEQPLCSVSDVELRRGGKSYTADTLRILSEERPEDHLFLLMGEDMFLTLQDWRRPEEIWSMADICAAPRSRDASEKLEAQKQALEARGARVHLCPISFLPISSTLVRETVREGRPLDGLVPRSVASYIAAHGLYRVTEET